MSDNNSDAALEAARRKRRKKPVMMGGGPGHRMAMMGGAKAKDFKGTLRQLLGYMHAYWAKLIVVFAFAILSTVFAIASPKILGNMTNQVVNDYIDMTVYDRVIANLPTDASIPAGITGSDILKTAPPEVIGQIPEDALNRIKSLDFTQRPTMDFGSLGRTALFLLGLFILSAAFGYIQGWIMSGISQEITYKFRRDISQKINRLPLKYLDDKTHGDILSRITNDVDTVSQTLNQGLMQIVTSVTMILGILIMMLSINVLMTLVSLIIIPLTFIFLGLILGRSQRLFKKQQDMLGQIDGHIEEMYAGHSVVKVFNGEQRSIDKFRSINNELYDSGWKSQFLSGLMFPMINAVGNLSFVFVSVLGGYLAVKGSVNIGDIQAFIQYVRQFNQPIIQSANIANVMQSTIAAAERVFEFLAAEEQVPETDKPVVLTKVKGDVKFENVVFGYNQDKIVIKGFAASIQAGQRVALVGPTGAGKTTMVNLLMRFYDVDKGAIKVDGVDIRSMRRSDLRKMFGMVLQDTWLFNGTICENICYGKPDASQEEIELATRSAQVDHFVHSLPKGYDMVINEEADNVSQGEKQLLTIARAMLMDPPILILDEATSSVDTRTEVMIQQAMDNLLKGRTSFIIAHRLSTIRNADLILVMQDGNIVEQGTHTALLSRNGFYAELYNSQFAE